MSTIDPTTNLPELPEGIYWEINLEHDTSRFFPVPTGYLRISIVEPITTEGVTVTGKLWWKKRVKFAHESTRSLAGARITKTVPAIPYAGDPDRKDGYKPSTDTEDVLAAAERALEAWNDRRRREALIGTYPPKTL